MKATGIVRRVDDLGRILIPKEIRRTLKITDGKPMEFFIDGDSIVLKKYGDAEMRKEQEIRNKAIDEFAEQISLEISESIIFGFIVDSDRVGNFDDASDKIVDYVIDTVKQIAEQMKGGVEWKLKI